jgi:hypothetical protein
MAPATVSLLMRRLVLESADPPAEEDESDEQPASRSIEMKT